MKRKVLKKEDARTLLLQGAFVKFNDYYTIHPGYAIFKDFVYQGSLRYDTFDKLKDELNLRITERGYSYQIWKI